MSTSRGARPLSDVEATFALMHSELGGATRVVTQLSFTGLLNEGRLHSAIRAWVAETPLLNTAVEWHADTLCLIDRPADSTQVTMSSTTSGVCTDGLLRTYLNAPLAPSGALWHLQIVRDLEGLATHLFFARSHAISDGATTVYLLRDLADRIFLTPPLRAPSVETRRSTTADCIEQPTLPDRSPGHPEPNLPAPFALAYAEPATRSADFVSWVMGPSPMEAAVRWAKSAGFTVNELLATVFATAVAQVTGGQRIGFFTAVSARRWQSAQAASTPGCSIGIVYHPVEVDPNDISSTVMSYRSRFGRALESWTVPQREHRDIERDVRALDQKRHSLGICITNTGSADGALGAHTARIGRFRTVVNRRAANYMLVLHASTLAGRFDLTLAFGTPSVSRTLAEKVRDAMVTELNQLACMKDPI